MIRDIEINQTVSDEETDTQEKVLVFNSIRDVIKVDSVEKIDKYISFNENKVIDDEILAVSNAVVRKADRSSRRQETLSDDYANDILDQHVEQEKPKVSKTNKATPNGVIISAHALL